MSNMIVSKLDDDEAPLGSYKQFSLWMGSVLESAPGTSGAVYASLFTALGNALPAKNDDCTASNLAKAYLDALTVVSGYSGADEGDCTMLDALFPAARAYLKTPDLPSAAAAAIEGAKK